MMRWISILGLSLLLANGRPAQAEERASQPQGKQGGLLARVIAAVQGGLAPRASKPSLGACLQRCAAGAQQQAGGLLGRLAAQGCRVGSSLRDSALSFRDRLSRCRERMPSLWLLKRRFPNGQEGKQEGKKWTVFVYMNADNNLHSSGLKDIQEMSAVGSNKDLNIVVLWDGSKEFGSGDEHQSKLLLVEKGGTRVLKALDEQDMGSAATLEKHVTSVMKEFEADRTAVVVWNHGAGWKGASYDDEPENHMTIAQMGTALTNAAQHLGRRIDVLGFDACLMNGAEVSHEVYKGANYCVASEELEPADGWDYTGFLKQLEAKPTMDGKELAKTICDTYVASYDHGSQGNWSACLSAVDLRAFERSSRLIDDFARALRAGYESSETERRSVALASMNSLRFWRSNVDLVDFARQVATLSSSAETARCAKRLDEFLTKELVTANATVGDCYKNAHGLSIYFPEHEGYYRDEKAAYAEVGLSKDMAWKQVLDAYYGTAMAHGAGEPPPPREPYPGYGANPPLYRVR